MSEMLPAVQRAFAAVRQPDPRDAGTRALAERYAALLDEAAPDRSYAKALRVLGEVVEQALEYAGRPDRIREINDAWEKVRDALAEHSVASDLGPKLLAALTAQGLSLAGRKEKADGGGQVQAMGNPLQLVRDEDAAARGGAA